MSLFSWLFRCPEFDGPHSDTNQPDECANFDDDDFSRVALDLIWPGPRTDDSFWGGTVEQCERAIKECDAIREKYSTLQPKRLRSAVMHWADYYERMARKDLADVISQKRKNEMDAYDKKCKAEAEKVRALKSLIKDGRC